MKYFIVISMLVVFAIAVSSQPIDVEEVDGADIADTSGK